MSTFFVYSFCIILIYLVIILSIIHVNEIKVENRDITDDSIDD